MAVSLSIFMCLFKYASIQICMYLHKIIYDTVTYAFVELNYNHAS